MKLVSKKSVSILLALSFSLGVVTPSESAYAKVLSKKEETQTNNTNQGNVNHLELLNKTYSMLGVRINAKTKPQLDIALALIRQKEVIDLTKYSYQTRDEIIKDVQKVQRQNPMVWGLKSFRVGFVKGGKKTVILTMRDQSNSEIQNRHYEIVDEMDKVTNLVDDSNQSIYNRINKLADYLDKEFTYDEVSQKENIRVNGSATSLADVYYKSFNAYGLVNNKYGVCDAFTNYAKVYFDKLGFETYMVQGRYNRELHSWLKVKTPKGFLNYDFTRSLRAVGVKKPVLGFSDTEMNRLGYTFNKDNSLDVTDDAIASPKVGYSYYKQYGGEFETVSNFTSTMVKNLKSKKPRKSYDVVIYKHSTEKGTVEEISRALNKYNKDITNDYTKKVQAEKKRKEDYTKKYNLWKKYPKKYKKPETFKPVKITKGKTYVTAVMTVKSNYINMTLK